MKEKVYCLIYTSGIFYNVLYVVHRLTDLHLKLMFKNDRKVKVYKVMITYFISTQVNRRTAMLL